MSSLWKKIFEHKKFDAHLKALELQSKEKQIEKSFEIKLLKVLKPKFTTTEKFFRVIYKIVKTQRLFVDLPNKIDNRLTNFKWYEYRKYFTLWKNICGYNTPHSIRNEKKWFAKI
jgi:hypothetical protein